MGVDLLDIDLAISEDCLHLAVTTPIQPDGSQVAPGSGLPVMFFIYGGAFYSGTQIMMGAERLAAWEEVVVVAINYRVGPLGFMCLDTDEAGGNMGLLLEIMANDKKQGMMLPLNALERLSQQRSLDGLHASWGTHTRGSCSFWKPTGLRTSININGGACLRVASPC